ncbi:hypothetical protein MMC12_005802 [Toensbergia leucococca]|nr:hypothetical protein [Toensbergia leucococca]
MAAWRERRYVPDSDEEDDADSTNDSVPFSNPDPTITIDGFQDIDAIFHGRTSEERISKPDVPLLLEEIITGRDIGDVCRIEHAPCPSVGALQTEHTEISLQVSTLDEPESTLQLSEEDEDLDELQQNYNRATPAAQLIAELLPRPQTTPNQSQHHTKCHQSKLPKASLPSSPLTEPTSTPHAIPPEVVIDISAQGHASSPVNTGLQHAQRLLFVSIPGHDDDRLEQHDLDNNLAESWRPARALRQRNPIQLHPYALESEKYRQSLKDRGVKPLRIAQTPAYFDDHTGQDPEELEFEAVEDTQVTSARVDTHATINSSPLSTQRVSRSRITNQCESLQIHDDEFPDVDAFLRHHPPGTAAQGYKRRKIVPELRKKPKPPSKGLSYSNGITSSSATGKYMRNEGQRPNPNGDHDLFDVPPSPPPSGNSTTSTDSGPTDKVFRFPRGISPAHLQTPVTSSEPREPPIVETGGALRSDDESISGGLEDLHSDKNSTISAADEEPDDGSQVSELFSEDERIHQLQRKIHGVLPASWLRLDLKKQDEKPSGARSDTRARSPGGFDGQRGIARPVASRARKRSQVSADRNIPIEISDDSGSDNESISQPTASKRGSSSVHRNLRERIQESLAFPSPDLGETIEDNRIDFMLPAISRTAKRSGERRKRQSKLIESVKVTRGSSSASNKPRGIRVLRRATARNELGSQVSHFRPPRLSIVDAPTPKACTHRAAPQYLKVAARTARSRNDKGRHSPSRKYIQLATKDDTDDPQETLRNWREGTIAARIQDLNWYTSNAVHDRAPLTTRSGNEQATVRSFSETSTTEDGPCSNTISLNLQGRPSNPQRSQISLSPVKELKITYNSHPRAHHMRLTRPRQRNLNLVQRKFLPTSRSIGSSRPAQLESPRNEYDDQNPRAAFQKNLHNASRFREELAAPDYLIARFIKPKETRPLSSISESGVNRATALVSRHNIEPNTRNATHLRARKRPPRRLVSDSSDFTHFNAPIAIGDVTDDTQIFTVDNVPRLGKLVGLGSFGTQYTDDFSITPFPTGTFFHESTFIGSGQFFESLQFTALRDLDSSRGFFSLQFEESFLRWGPWNDDVSSQFGVVFEKLSDEVQILISLNSTNTDRVDTKQPLAYLQGIIRYFSKQLNFLDPIDRVPCLQRCKSLVSNILRDLGGDVTASAPSELPRSERVYEKLSIQTATLAMVLANQLYKIADHGNVSLSLKAEMETLLCTAARRALTLAFHAGLQPFRQCFEDFRNQETREHGLGEHHYRIEALVVAQHVLRETEKSIAAFWDIILDQIPATNPEKLVDIQKLESHWHKIFVVLPILEFDANGILDSGRRYKIASDSWIMAKRLVNPILETYMANPRGQAPSLNTYCRALLGRCLHLINGWGWQRCEFIVGTLFDIFAGNNLANLQNEESHGSTSFLESLDKNPALDLAVDDRCFHIFLKIIGSGLRHMREIYPEKRVRDLVWRLMPNHGRLHPKDEAIRQQDLDALRNHHDLLCTLYWASPAGFRPRLALLRNLVHLETSHREACHINIRAWSNLVRFQLSTQEPIDSLEPFVEWHNDLLGQIVQQHNLARIEAEEQVKLLESSADPSISTELLESTIARNQRQVEAILSDALISLKHAVVAASDLSAARILLSPTMTTVFGLLDARRSRTNQVILQSLDIILAYTDRCTDHHAKSQSTDEDSQDYGDWSAFHDDDNTINPAQRTAALHLHHVCYEPMRHLLSNCFGADDVPEDSILMKVVASWIAVAHILVHQGIKSWQDYISQFGHDSWKSLRDTKQTRKFTAYFLAALIEKDKEVLQDHNTFFTSSWLVSLVERESVLKYQAKLTVALLNAQRDNPLLKNLPFSADSNTGMFNISVSDFRGRRLSLMSSILSNMRQSMDNAFCHQPRDVPKFRQEYKELLQSLMAAMKQNYLELGHGTDARGAYVDFVQQVVGFLQQYTSEICSIDRFFTDSAAFPLPSTDPTYVVGRLKNYGLRLQDLKTPKQLAVFIQAVSERAAADGQQVYLVNQIYSAMSDLFESGEQKPTLRSFLVQAVIPVYVEISFSTSCGWLLALPLLRALQKVFIDFLLDVDGTSAASVEAALSTITVYLDSIRTSIGLLIDHSGLLEQATILRILGACYAISTAALPIVDYFARLSRHSQRVSRCITFLKCFSTFAVGTVMGHEDVRSPEDDPQTPETTAIPFPEIRRFALHELRDTLSKTWTCHDGHYYVVRGNMRREVVTDIGSYREEKELLLVEIEAFLDCLQSMPGLGDCYDCSVPSRSRGFFMDDVFI